MFTRFLSAWNQWWFRTCPPHLLAVFRIVFGAFHLFYWGLRIPHIAMLYSREGIILPLLSPQPGSWTMLFAPPSVLVASVIFGALYLSLVMFTLGFRTRTSAVIAFLLYVYYWILSLHVLSASFDRLFLLFFLILAFSGCGKTFSLDMRLKRGSWTAWEPISIVPQRLLAVQIAATYLGVGWQKMWLPDWQSGEVIAWGFVGRWATPFAYAIDRLNLPMWVFDWQVHTVKYFEFTIPFGLWIRKWYLRWWYMLGGALFHTGITLILAIWWFQVLIPAYIVFFSPEEVFEWCKRIGRGRVC